MNGKSLDGLRRLSPLLAAARRAEEISRDVALRQSALAPLPALQRALRHQSRQEAVHAAVFGAALALLPGPVACPPALAQALGAFETRLNADLDEGALAASMFGLQWVLEGLGSVALQPPEGEVAALGDRFLPLRSLLLLQERGHRRLGEVWVPRLAAAAGEQHRARLLAAGAAYLGLAQAVVEAGLRALPHFPADARHYAGATRTFFEQSEGDLPRLVGPTAESPSPA